MRKVRRQTEYIPFTIAPVFNCTINGKSLTGIVEGQYRQQEKFGLQVNFSDGFKPLFIALDSGGWWCEENARPYLDVIQKELNRFVASRLNEFISSNSMLN